MSFITTQTAQVMFLTSIVHSDVLRLKLFANDWTPSKTDTVSQYTELVYLGYAAKLLTPSEWTIDIDGLTGNYVASFAQQIWTFSSSITVYGYYITDSGGTNVYFAERFPDAPVTLVSGGGNVKITPTIGIK
jgi:hypothetical protein